MHEIERDMSALREPDEHVRGLGIGAVRLRRPLGARDDRVLRGDRAAPGERAVRELLIGLGTHEPTELARSATQPRTPVGGQPVYPVEIDDGEPSRPWVI